MAKITVIGTQVNDLFEQVLKRGGSVSRQRIEELAIGWRDYCVAAGEAISEAVREASAWKERAELMARIVEIVAATIERPSDDQRERHLRELVAKVSEAFSRRADGSIEWAKRS